jgi:hypothetical protein
MVAPAKPIFSDSDCEALRCAAFVDALAMPLVDERGRQLGPRVSALTPWRHNLLYLYHSPFVMGTTPTRRQLIQALWILSPRFKVGSRLAFLIFSLRWRFLSRPCAVAALSVWVRAQFIDSPPKRHNASDEPGDIADPHWLASFVLTAMQRLAWSEAEVLHTPYSRLFQYFTAMDAQASDRQRPRFNHRRDQQARAYLLAKKARLAAGQAAATP